jgi:Zn-dependent protease
MVDGGHFISNLLPPRLAYHYNKIEPYGFIILILLIISGLLVAFIKPLIAVLAIIVSFATGRQIAWFT